MSYPTSDTTYPTGAAAAAGAAAAFDGVVAPAVTSESTAAGVGLAAKTFGAFTDPHGLIDNYNAVHTSAVGSASWSGSGLGAYTPTDADGDAGTLALQARDSSNNVLATAYHSYDRAAAAAAFDGVVAPAATSESTAAGVGLAAKTFGAFTDTHGLIDNYNAVHTSAAGSASWSGSGLGAYTPTDADGDSGTLALQARDSSNNVLATAYHSYDRALAVAFDGVVAPAVTSESTAAGVGLAAKTFGAFTDPHGLIDNYNAVNTAVAGAAVWSGSGLGAYTPTDADGDAGTLALQARDSSNNVLATAYHSYDRAPAAVTATSSDIDLTTDTKAEASLSDATHTIYEADEVTAKATVTVRQDSLLDGSSTRTTSVNTTDGLKLNHDLASGSHSYASAALKVDLAGEDLPADQILVQAIVTFEALANANNNQVGIMLGPEVGYRDASSGAQCGIVVWDTGPSVLIRAERHDNTSYTLLDTGQNVTLPATFCVGWLIQGGMIAHVYWEERSTFWSGIPTPDGSTTRAARSGIGIGGGPNENDDFTSNNAAYLILGSATYSGVVEHRLTKTRTSVTSIGRGT